MYRFNIPGPRSHFPDPRRFPLMAQTPAGPSSVFWSTDYYNSLQPELAGLRQDSFAPVYDNGYQPSWWQRLIDSFRPHDYPAPEPLPGYYPDEPPTYRADVSCPYGPDVWKWVIGTAVVMLVLMGQKNK